MTSESTAQIAQAVRAFNRFYTRKIGVLDEGILDSSFSLTEVRVLYELANRDGPTASQIGKALGLDAGYLSRILRAFEASGYLSRQRSQQDSRSSVLRLTAKGRKAFAPLDRRSQQEASTLLQELSSGDQQRLLNCMAVIQRLLNPGDDATQGEIRYREHRAGDIGWAIERHGVLYGDEYGWNQEFEGLVAEILGKFLNQQDPERERCWIAEHRGQRVGCVFLVSNAQESDVAQLRCLLVEPSARGLGIGQRLVAECLQFARQAGYRRMMLWTNDVLLSARRIYEAAGFQLVKQEQHHSFGADLVGQYWEKTL